MAISEFVRCINTKGPDYTGLEYHISIKVISTEDNKT